jgi:transcriptional regulator with XRE-family HTH domain
MTLEQFLKQKREQADMTQGQLAVILGLESPQYVSNFERGACVLSAKHFKVIAKVLRIDLGDMINLRGEDVKAELRKQIRGTSWKNKAAARAGS